MIKGPSANAVFEFYSLLDKEQKAAFNRMVQQTLPVPNKNEVKKEPLSDILAQRVLANHKPAKRTKQGI